MKKTIQFIAMIALTVLLTSCNSTVAYPAPATATPEVTPIATLAPTPAPTATPVPTPEPTREPSGTSFDFAKKYCEKYGDEYTEEFAAAFNHAVWSMPTDYSNINPDFPHYLYEHPYNMWAEPTLKKDNAFKTNVECIAEYGIDEVTAIMEAAKGFANADINQDYTTIDEEETYKNFYSYLPSFAEETDYVDDILAEAKKENIIRKGVFITDPSLVYHCTDGMYRVRGRALFTFSHAKERFYTKSGIAENTWYWIDVEYNVIPDTIIEGTKYLHGRYVVYNWLNISDGRAKADLKMIALAEAHMA